MEKELRKQQAKGEGDEEYRNKEREPGLPEGRAGGRQGESRTPNMRFRNRRFSR